MTHTSLLLGPDELRSLASSFFVLSQTFFITTFSPNTMSHNDIDHQLRNNVDVAPDTYVTGWFVGSKPKCVNCSQRNGVLQRQHDSEIRHTYEHIEELQEEEPRVCSVVTAGISYCFMVRVWACGRGVSDRLLTVRSC